MPGERGETTHHHTIPQGGGWGGGTIGAGGGGRGSAEPDHIWALLEPHAYNLHGNYGLEEGALSPLRAPYELSNEGNNNA